MIRLTSTVLIVLTVLLGTTPTAHAQSSATPDGETIIVRMVDKSNAEWRFEPAQVTVQPGDTLRFVQADVVPHNVEFTATPEGADLGEARMGPFLNAKGETYDLVIDGRFAAGPYEYVCTPHVAMGMKASVTVEPLSPTASTD